ncbi:MAG: AI-2E family transporter [Chloroflexi bacterium]|nr:AI-2E family transporter [Chloroflexota bacterium]
MSVMNTPARTRPSLNQAVPAAWLRALVLPLILLAWLALLIVAGWLLGYVTRTLLVVVLSGVLAFAFTPLANWLARWLPRPVALGVAYVIGLGVIFGFGAYVVSTTADQVTSLVTNLPTYAEQGQGIQSQLEGVTARFGIAPSSVSDLEQQAVGQLQTTGTAVARDSLARLADIAGTLIDLILVLILSVYLAANGTRIAEWLKTETPSGSTRYRSRLLVTVVSRVVGGYIRGVLLLALLVGVLVGVGLAVLGVPYAVLLGVLAFFMEFIPVLGVFISGAAALIIAIVHFQEVLRPLLVLGYFVVVHVIEGDVIGPRIMGRAVGIHPATGLIALVAGTELFGIWGALFAAPLAGLLQAIVTAAWLEFRGGKPQEVLQAMTEDASAHVERQVEVPAAD